MKFLFFTLIFLTNKCWSQDVILNDQFKKVISEVNNEFKSLKGNFKNVSDNGDSVFHSHVFLEEPSIRRLKRITTQNLGVLFAQK